MKKNSINYPLTVIEIENYSKVRPIDILNKFDQNEYGIVDEEKTLLFADANDRVKFFNLTNSNVILLDRNVNLTTYSDANKLYKILLNARTWLIHGGINYCIPNRRSEEQGNFVLLLNATELYIKNQILNGLRRLLDSFLTNRRFTFEINFEEIMKGCFKHKLEIQYFLKINTSKFKTVKCNLVFQTTPSSNDPLHQSLKKNGSIFQRFRNVLSNTITTTTNVFKFSLNTLPYLCFQYETKNTYTFFVKNEDKILKVLKYSPSSVNSSSKPLSFINMTSNDFIKKNMKSSSSSRSSSTSASNNGSSTRLNNARKASTSTIDSCCRSKNTKSNPEPNQIAKNSIKTFAKSERVKRSNRLSKQILLNYHDLSLSDDSLQIEKTQKLSSTLSKKKLNVLKECMRSSDEHIYEDISQTTNGSIETDDFIFLNTNAFRKQDYYLPKSYSFSDLTEENLKYQNDYEFENIEEGNFFTNKQTKVLKITTEALSAATTKSIVRHAKLFTSESHLF